MIIVRSVAQGIRAHWRARFAEWLLAVGLTGWGGTLLSDPPTFPISPAYAQMAVLAPEEVWGSVAIAIGIVRLLALTANGTFAHRAWGRHSPHVRAVMALLSAGVWFMIFMGLLLSGTSAPGVAIYGVIMVFDIQNFVSALGDAGESDATKATKNARS